MSYEQGYKAGDRYYLVHLREENSCTVQDYIAATFFRSLNAGFRGEEEESEFLLGRCRAIYDRWMVKRRSLGIMVPTAFERAWRRLQRA